MNRRLLSSAAAVAVAASVVVAGPAMADDHGKGKGNGEGRGESHSVEHERPEHPENHGKDVSEVAHGKGSNHGEAVSEVAKKKAAGHDAVMAAGLTREQAEAVKAVIDAQRAEVLDAVKADGLALLVSDGVLTQEQADALAKATTNKQRRAAARSAGISRAEMKTVNTVLSDARKAATSVFTPDYSVLVADGVITQEQADVLAGVVPVVLEPGPVLPPTDVTGETAPVDGGAGATV